MPQQLVSPGDRPITYLRISVTDRCDMRCTYCMPAEGAEFIPLSAHMTPPEIVRVVSVAAAMGVSKVRLTGGEPLVRPGLVELVREIAHLDGIAEVALSTNAQRLERYALPLAEAGLKRVNISLDTLDPHQFAQITRGGSLERVLAGIAAAEQAGLKPVKINAVVMRGHNDAQILPLVAMGVERGWQVRFIEYMPIGCAAGQWEPLFMAADEILAKVREGFALEAIPGRRGDPARIYRVTGSAASVGVITPVTQHFCDSCNRMRLTADGRLRSCLLVNGEADLKAMIRDGASDEAIAEVLARTAALKPEWHGVTPGSYSEATRTLREIGG